MASSIFASAVGGRTTAIKTTGTVDEFADVVAKQSLVARSQLRPIRMEAAARTQTTVEERQRLGRELARDVKKEEEKLILEYPDALVTGVTTRPLLKGDLIRIIPGNRQPETLYTCEVKSSKGCRTGQKFSAVGTLNDPAMGAPHKGGECHQFQCTDCPGHFGYHHFPEPIIHPFFLGTILQILGVVCSVCSRPLFTDANLIETLKRIPKAERLGYIQEQLGKNTQSGIACPYGNAPPPQHLIEDLVKRGLPVENKSCGPPRIYLIKESQNSSTIYYKTSVFETKLEMVNGQMTEVRKKKPDKQVLSAEDVISIMSKISEEDFEIMGLNKEYVMNGYILHGLPILPPICRPAPSYEGMKSSKEHNFTVAINAVLEQSEALEHARRNSSSNDKTDRHRALYEAVSNYFIMLTKSLSGKEGFMRSNMTAKRGDHAGRAVIGPALPSTPLGWVEVPEYMAKKTRITETVNPDNIKVLRKLLRLGKIHQIQTRRGTVKTITPGKLENITLNVGDKVERELENGDWAVLNRAPSIQQQNVSSHRVLIVNNRATLGIPVADLPPKGGDYDGDEMSFWPAQTMEARRELRKLMDIRRNIISSQTSTPITGLILNSISLLYILTDDETYVSRKTFDDCKMLMRSRAQLRTFDQRLASAKLHPLSGKALFSALLPAGFTYVNYGVKIIDGILVDGKISSLTVGAGKNRSIIHMLWHFAGFKRTAEFISDAAHVMDRWNLDYGMSLTLDDFLHANDPKSIVKINDLYNAAQKYYEDIGLDATDIDLMNAVRHVSNVGVDILEDDNLQRAEKLRELSIYTREQANVGLLNEAIDKLVESDSLKIVLKDILGPLYREDFPRTIPILSQKDVLTSLVTILKNIFIEEIDVEDPVAKQRSEEDFLLHYLSRLSTDPVKMEMFIKMIRTADFTIPHEQRLLSAISRNFINERLSSLLRQLITPLKNTGFSKTFYMLSRDDVVLTLFNIIHDMFRDEPETFPTDEEFLVHYLEKIVADSNKFLRFQAELYREMEHYAQVIFDFAEQLGKSKQNTMLLMSKKMSGAKGSAGNIGEIFGPKGMSSTTEGCLERDIPGNRISTLFAPEDPSLIARGLCIGNFSRGLDVEESLAHAQANRESQGHSATLLPDLGFTRRQLARALENLVVEDGTQIIDKVTGMLIQTIYGGDGFLPQELINVDGIMTFADVISYSLQLNTEFGWIPDFTPAPAIYSDEHHLYPSHDIGDRLPDVFDIKAFDLSMIDIDDEENAFFESPLAISTNIITEDGWDLTR